MDSCGMEKANYVASEALRWALSDEAWRLFGYRSRPKYGAIVQRLRRPAKVRLEKKILLEMIITCISHYILLNTISKRELELVVRIPFEYENVAESLGFSSSSEAIHEITVGVIAYTEINLNDWDKKLLERLNWDSIEESEFKAQILGGIAEYSLFYKDLITENRTSE